MATKELTLAPGVTEPLAFITESTAILGKKGSGKTSAGVVIVEEVYAHGVPFIVVDPKGDWYGLRSRADGGPGISVPIFGGLHADIPLEATAGKYVAELLRRQRLSAILDVSEFSISERAKFLAPFAESLYRFDSKDPVMLVLEEAHEYIPQQAQPDEKRMLGNFERLVKLGRWKGLGVLMMTQRSASLNKNVLTQADNLIVMQTTSPQDRLAVKGWIDTMADGMAADVLSRLPSLKPGEGWLWQPSRGVPFQFRFRQRWTYDAGATPEVGKKALPPATLADVDLKAITTAMAETIEKAKADDPKALRARIAELERHIRDHAPEKVEVVREVEKLVDHPVLTPEDRVLIRDLVAAAETLGKRVQSALVQVDVRTPPKLPPRTYQTEHAGSTIPAAQPTIRSISAVSAEDGLPGSYIEMKLGKAERAILAGLATHGAMPHKRLALIAGYSATSSGFKNPLATLRRVGYAVGGGDSIAITDAGVEALGDFEPLPSGRELIDYWMGSPQFGKAERAILGALIEAYPNPLTHVELAEAAGYEPTSSGFKNPLAKLRRLELAHGNGTAILVDDTLGEAAA